MNEASYDDARDLILTMGRQLKEWVEPAASTTSSPPTESSAPAPSEPVASEAAIATQLHEEVDDLRPLIDQVAVTHPDAEDDLIDKMSDIVDQIRAKQFVEARGNIDALSHALNHLGAKS